MIESALLVAAVFELFHRLNPKQIEGKGLELCIGQQALDPQQGRIWVESAAKLGAANCANPAGG